MTALRTFAAALLLIVAIPLAVLAQAAPPDYAAWEQTAQRAEEVVEAGRASDAALENLREQVAGWREQFLAAQSINADRIATLKSQIAALGPAPAEGETEAPEIAARRTELNEQLTRLRTPGVTAEIAYNRADGLIGEIDGIIRERQTDALLQLGPSPLNPAHWPGGLTALTGSISALGTEAMTALRNPVQQSELRNNLIRVLGYILIGGLLMFRGRLWIEQLGLRLSQTDRRGTPIWAFLVSLGQIAVPMIGVVAVTEAIFASGMVGLRGTVLLDQLPQWAFIFLLARWLGGRLFPKTDAPALTGLAPERRAGARWYVALLAVIVVVRDVVKTLADYDFYSDADRAVLGLPLLVLAGVTLFRFGQLLRAPAPQVAEGEASERAYSSRISGLLGRAAMAVGVIGPVMAMVGYGAGANALVYPAILTLVIFGIVRVLQSLVGDFWTAFQGDEASDGLVPVLIGFLLSLMALPVLALVWGARIADLTELWARFREGFSFGDTTISPTDFLTFAIVFTIGYMLTRVIQGALRNTVLPKTKIDIGGQNAIVSGTGYIGIFLAAIISISSAGLDLSSLAIVAGALSVGIGFGLQNIVSNFVSGIILLIERPISEGDWIEVGGQMGYVRDISVRSTRIETFDRTDVIVPNADLVSGTVTNYTRGNSIGRVIVPVGVAYGTDTRKVEDILKKIARDHEMVLMNPAPAVIFQGFGADSLDFEIRAILRDVNYLMSVKSEMNHTIAKAFAEEDIEIPFAQRDVWLRNPEVLNAQGASDAAGDNSANKSANEDADKNAGGDTGANGGDKGDNTKVKSA